MATAGPPAPPVTVTGLIAQRPVRPGGLAGVEHIMSVDVKQKEVNRRARDLEVRSRLALMALATGWCRRPGAQGAGSLLVDQKYQQLRKRRP